MGVACWALGGGRERRIVCVGWVLLGVQVGSWTGKRVGYGQSQDLIWSGDKKYDCWSGAALGEEVAGDGGAGG